MPQRKRAVCRMHRTWEEEEALLGSVESWVSFLGTSSMVQPRDPPTPTPLHRLGLTPRLPFSSSVLLSPP